MARRKEGEPHGRRRSRRSGSRTGKRRLAPRARRACPVKNMRKQVAQPFDVDFQMVRIFDPCRIFMGSAEPGKRSGSRRDVGLPN